MDDTPGTNAIHREHERLTREFVPRSDLVLFVTSADRPFTESERGFLQGIRDWGKKIVVVVNKMDRVGADFKMSIDSMRKKLGANDNARKQYKLLATSRTGTLQKELQQVGAVGYEVMGMTVGKTALALNLAENAAKLGAQVAIFSLEMSKESLLTRMLCSAAPPSR